VRDRRAVWLGAWLVLVAVCQLVALSQLVVFFVRGEHGQLLDTVALAGTGIGRARVDGPVSTALNAVSVLSVLTATAMVGFIALVRRRFVVAVVATVLIAGANVTTQLLKYVIVRPDLGVDEERAAAGNSLPSGHATVAASVAVAFMLVLPPRGRAAAAIVGGAYTAFVGVATMSAGWHRPSDAVAAFLVVGVWAAVAGLVLLVAQRTGDVVQTRQSQPVATTALAVVGLALFAVALVALRLTDAVLGVPVDELSRRRLLAAYAGSAAGVVAAAVWMMALVLATLHRVVPERLLTEPSRPVRREDGVLQ
jgi:membrane-associated phospholipid phosphatase